jgi:hypothetical protein
MSPRLLRPRATGFNPKSIAGLAIWADISKTSSLTFNGSTVSQVNDLSGNGFHFTQSTANNQPTYQATGANGRPTLLFDGTDLMVSSATIANYILNPTTGPAFVVVMVAFWPTAASSGSLLAGSDSQAAGRVLIASNFGGSGGNTLFDVVDTSTGRLSTGAIGDETVSPHVVTFYRQLGTMAYRIDGAVRGSLTGAVGNFATTTAKFQVGKVDAVGGTLSMYMSETLVYAAVLSAGDIQKAERGLGKKWGITVV